MKKFLSILAVVLLAAVTAMGQSPSPGIFNYQGVARNSVGNVLINKTITLRLTIHDGAAAGPTVYQESRTATTNPFGLFNVQVGSAGASNVTGTIAGVIWGVNTKFIQVEIDPNGGTTFINIGTAQIASVPYALYASLANDLVLPFIKTQAAIGSTLIGLTNSATTGVQGAFTGTSASTDGNAYAITGTISSSSPGGFSSGVRGINNGTGGLGIGVYGSQNGSGWGVYGTTPSGIGVHGNSASGFGVYGLSTSGVGVYGNSSTGRAGFFEITNSASSANALYVRTTTTSAPALTVSGPDIWGSAIGINNSVSGMEWRMNVQGTTWQVTKVPGSTFTPFQLFSDGQVEHPSTTGATRLRILDNGNVGIGTATPGHKLHVVQTGTTSAGLFSNTNAANASSTVSVSSNSTSGVGVQVTQTGTGQVSAIYGAINTTTGASTAIGGADFSSGGASPIELRTYAVLGQTGTTGIAVGGYALNGGTALRGSGGGVTGWALNTSGRVSMSGINEALNRILTSDAAGNATWQDAAAVGVVTGSGTLNFVPKWTPSGTNLGNSLIFDNGTNVGLGTITPSYRFTVSHGGSTGALVTSTAGFSVVDINAANGDAALRFQRAGVNQWNIRNRPADDFLEIFELGGGGSRMVIANATGNVGIGATINPTYKLDVENLGANGIRSRSSSGFSVVDIDGFNGDAALRFVKNGVNQWNIRNRPADDFLEIFELGGGGSRFVIENTTGDVGIGGDPTLSYRLDVTNPGASGIRSRSTASFSVVDIDAASGDAALRFQKSGVNQWNIRNRPADDFLEIFELGGGGSRFTIENTTGDVGIGSDPTGTYRLDVTNSGGSGIRSRSTSSFSVVDIDALSGDAALRFQKNGVNQWNIRNRPADDFLEIYELGGGGSRFTIENTTGDVGIGSDPTGTYRLDVTNSGGSGIRSRSIASFSVVDIDGQSGDAALRFQNAGVNQWNTRNNPANNDYQIFELGASERLRIENTTGRVVIAQNLHVNGTLSKTAGAFKIDHPLDPENKYLVHSFVESPDMMNIYNGNIVTDASGKATVKLPDYFEALNMEFRYQLTVIGAFAQAIINKEVSNNKFEIATNQPNVKVSWQVTGVRHDAYANKNRIPNVVEKEAVNKGKYLTPDAYNLPDSKGIGYNLEPKESSLNEVKIAPAKAAQPETIVGTSLEQKPVQEITAKSIDNTGSVANTEPKKEVVKPVDISGSVAPQTEIKKAEVKPVDVKGTSVEDVKKPAVQEKKPAVDPGSTKTD